MSKQQTSTTEQKTKSPAAIRAQNRRERLKQEQEQTATEIGHELPDGTVKQPDPNAAQMSDADIADYLRRTGQVAVPAAEVRKKPSPVAKPTQRTEREPDYALPIDAGAEAVTMRAHPDYDYAVVYDDDQYNRGPAYYRSELGYSLVNVDRKDGQDIILLKSQRVVTGYKSDGSPQRLTIPESTTVVRPGHVLMARPKSKSAEIQKKYDAANDPKRDKPELLREYVPAFNPAFLGLYGDAAATKKATNEFKVYAQERPGKTPESYTVDHTAQTFVFDKEGRLRLVESFGATPEAMASDFRILLNS